MCIGISRRVSGQMVRVIKRPTSIEERRRKCVENGGRRRKRDKSLTMTTSRSWHSSDAVFRYLCRCQPDIHADIQRRTREARSIREKLIFIVFEEWLFRKLSQKIAQYLGYIAKHATNVSID